MASYTIDVVKSGKSYLVYIESEYLEYPDLVGTFQTRPDDQLLHLIGKVWCAALKAEPQRIVTKLAGLVAPEEF